MDAGSVGYRAANVTHQVANPGRTPMRVIEVELK
jgi:mannose-6-phosphate isomerase-like protein (cupin superfamily)